MNLHRALMVLVDFRMFLLTNTNIERYPMQDCSGHHQYLYVNVVCICVTNIIIKLKMSNKKTQKNKKLLIF